MVSYEATQRLIRDLIRAANLTENLSPLERANLLRRSTAVVRKCRVTLRRSGISVQATVTREDPTRYWDEMARMIQFVPAGDVADEFLEAASFIKACRAVLEQGQQ